MKKKFLAVVLSMAMTVFMMAGCGSSVDDYVSDIETMAGIASINFDDMMSEDGLKEVKSEINKLKFSTKEGKVLKKDMLEMTKLVEDLLELMEDPKNADIEKAEKYTKDLAELQEKVEEDTEAFLDAAEAAGVEEEDLEGIDLGL